MIDNFLNLLKINRFFKGKRIIASLVLFFIIIKSFSVHFTEDI